MWAFWIAVSVFVLCASKKMYNTVFSPIGIMTAVWSCSIGLYTLAYYQSRDTLAAQYHQPWSGYTWIIILGGMCCFALGSVSGEFMFRSKGGIIKRTTWFILSNQQRGRLRKFIICTFVILFSGFLYEAYILGTLPLFSSNPFLKRTEFAQSYVHYLCWLLQFEAVLAYVYLRLVGFKKNSVIVAILSISFFALLSLACTAYIVKPLIMVAVSESFIGGKSRIRLKYLFLVTLVLVVFLVCFFIINSARGVLKVPGQRELIILDELGMDYIYHQLVIAHGYNRDPLATLRYLLEEKAQRLSYGAVTFRPLWSFLFVKEHFQFAYAPVLPFNPSTYISDFYRDFGVIGPFIFPFLIGLLSTWMFICAKVGRDVFVVIIYSLIAHNLIFSFFYNFFSHTGMWIALAFFILCKLYVEARYVRFLGLRYRLS